MCLANFETCLERVAISQVVLPLGSAKHPSSNNKEPSMGLGSAYLFLQPQDFESIKV